MGIRAMAGLALVTIGVACGGGEATQTPEAAESGATTGGEVAEATQPPTGGRCGDPSGGPCAQIEIGDGQD